MRRDKEACHSSVYASDGRLVYICDIQQFVQRYEGNNRAAPTHARSRERIVNIYLAVCLAIKTLLIRKPACDNSLFHPPKYLVQLIYQQGSHLTYVGLETMLFHLMREISITEFFVLMSINTPQTK